MIKKNWILFLILGTSMVLSAQSPESKLLRAKEFYKNGKYEATLSLLTTDRELRVENSEARFIIALSNYHLNQLDEAERIIQELRKDNKSNFKESMLYLGRIYHARNQFEEAAKYYKVYLKSLPSNHEHRAMVRDAVRRCSNGLQIQFREGMAYVENMGEGINSKYDDFGANQSPNYNNRLYFSSARPGSMGGLRNKFGQPDDLMGQYRNDMYSVIKEGDKWQNLRPLHYFLNSPQHEVVFGFNQTGRVLYYYKGNQLERGQIFVDTFRQNNQVMASDPFFGPVDASATFSAPHFVDSKTILFSSRRPGGYGGFDLYQTTYVDGQWTAPQNLGPDVNTAYDETTPYLAADGKTLYFSTNDSNTSMGGFDVFKSVYNSELKRWSKPYNLGLPINSAGDDTHLKLAKDGYTAYFTSNRKDGLGKRDIFVAYFFDFLNETKSQ